MLSVVIPVLDEEESLEPFYRELVSSLKVIKDYEVIFVDDGSRDNSLEILKRLARKDKKIKIFSFRTNQGKAEALTLGFQKAKGDMIVTLDADLQDKPSQIIKLIKKSKEGWDLVSGWREKRKDKLSKIISSTVFNSLSSWVWGIKMKDLNSGLKLYSKDAAKSLILYGGMHRFIPLLLYQKGFRVVEIPTEHGKRKFGKSKYGFKKIFTEMPDMFTMIFLSKYAQRPLHFFGLIGALLLFLGLIILTYLTLVHFEGGAIGRRPLLIFGMLLILSGLQVLFTGFLADLLIHLSSKNGNGKEDSALKYQT